MNKNSSKKNRISRCNGYSLFFIEPKKLININFVATELINLKSVKEVAITSGKYGFLVKCLPYYEKENEVIQHIKKNIGTVSKLECHYSYVR
ncbi:MAG: hypothetical protein QXD23_03495 [Candidatus Micrarchaeaceae archaeon]